MMSEKPQLKQYKSGYTLIEYYEGVHPQKDGAYLLHYSKYHDTLSAYTIVNMRNTSTDDVARWLNHHPTDDRLQYIISPKAEFCGNTYRFMDSDDGDMFLRLFMTDVVKNKIVPCIVVEQTRTQYGVHFDCLPPDVELSVQLATSVGTVAAMFANTMRVFKQQPPQPTALEKAA